MNFLEEPGPALAGAVSLMALVNGEDNDRFEARLLELLDELGAPAVIYGLCVIAWSLTEEVSGLSGASRDAVLAYYIDASM